MKPTEPEAKTRRAKASFAWLVQLVCSVILMTLPPGVSASDKPDYDVVVIGAGIAGISTALEASERGARVAVVEMNSMPGGHSIMSSGGIFVAGSPLQQKYGIVDSADLAYSEWIKYGEDADGDWARYYVDHSVSDVYRWLEGLGVTFEMLMHVAQDGNSVPRHHVPRGSGRGLLLPMIKELFSRQNVDFHRSTFAMELVSREGRVIALRARNVRTGKEAEIHGRTFVIATGGFASNLKMVEQYWPAGLQKPKLALAGSGVNSQGYGHTMAEKLGAELKDMSRLWIYPTGAVNPLDRGAGKGIEVLSYYLWLDNSGRRISNPGSGMSEHVESVLKMTGGTFWSLVDSTNKHKIFVTGSDWLVDQKRKYTALFENPEIVKRADTLDELARKMRVEPETMKASVEEYNKRAWDKIESPPFFAIRHFPLIRKTMGGIRTNLKSQVLDKESRIIPGLYAAGEAAGFGGGNINGKRALEGTFLGPCVLTGRVAGRHAAEEARRMKDSGE